MKERWLKGQSLDSYGKIDELASILEKTNTEEIKIYLQKIDSKEIDLGDEEERIVQCIEEELEIRGEL